MKPNFQEYSIDELYDVYEHIDKETYPERYDEVNSLIKSHEAIIEEQVKAKEAKIKAKEAKVKAEQHTSENIFKKKLERVERQMIVEKHVVYWLASRILFYGVFFLILREFSLTVLQSIAALVIFKITAFFIMFFLSEREFNILQKSKRVLHKRNKKP